MNTEQLIAALSTEVPKVHRRALALRVATGIALGCVAALALVVAMLGIRPDLGEAMQGFAFWMKSVYCLSLGVGAAWIVSRLSRPVSGSLRPLWLLAAPVLVLVGIGIGELARTPADQWTDLWLSGSWRECPWFVLSLSVPVFVGLLWSFRRLAPTRLRAAGAAAGLAAGGFAATIYCLHCGEVSAVFVLIWYTLGIVLAAALGALLGPRVLRW